MERPLEATLSNTSTLQVRKQAKKVPLRSWNHALRSGWPGPAPDSLSPRSMMLLWHAGRSQQRGPPTPASMCQLRLVSDTACASCTQITACAHFTAQLVKQHEGGLLQGFDLKGSLCCQWHRPPPGFCELKLASACRHMRQEMALTRWNEERRPPFSFWTFYITHGSSLDSGWGKLATAWGLEHFSKTRSVAYDNVAQSSRKACLSWCKCPLSNVLYPW